VSEHRLRILHLVLMLGETNSQYNEHCLPMAGVRDLGIVTYFPPRLTPPPEIAVFAGDGSVRGFLRALRRALDARAYDAVHAHAPESAAMLLFALVTWGRLRRLRRSLVYTVHDSFYDYSARNQALMLLTLWAFRSVVFCSDAARDSFPRPWKRLVRGRDRVVRNGADLDRVERTLALAGAAPHDRFTVISVGRLERVKDPEVVVDAFRAAAADEDRLVVIGTGALAPAVVEHAERVGLNGNVTFTGLIRREDVFRRCGEADVFISTSRGEGLPVAVIEAMAAGCAAVLSDIPPHRELVGDATFIPLVEPGDVDGFADELRLLRAMGPAARGELGRRCREHVRSRFSLPAMHAGYDVVYRDLARSAAT
jgi:glycosyltransferase involved in cell wall biosynthesis